MKAHNDYNAKHESHEATVFSNYNNVVIMSTIKGFNVYLYRYTTL